MHTNTLVGMVLVLVAAIGVGLFFILRHRKRKAVLTAMSPAEREHHDAVMEYNARVKAAEAALGAETRARESRLKAANKAVAAAGSVGTTKLGGYKGREGAVSYSGLNITVQGQTFPLDASIIATVDTAGNLATSSRSTFTRVAAGGVLFGPVGAIVGASAKKTQMHDTRELYLLIEGTGFAQLITCNPNDGQKVRQVAMGIKQAAMRVAQTAEQRTHAIAAASDGLAREQANTVEVTAAAAALEATKANTARLEGAKLQLAIDATAPAPVIAALVEGAPTVEQV